VNKLNLGWITLTLSLDKSVHSIVPVQTRPANMPANDKHTVRVE